MTVYGGRRSRSHLECHFLCWAPAPFLCLFCLRCLHWGQTSCWGKCASSSPLSVLWLADFSIFPRRLIQLQLFHFNSTNVSADHTGHLHPHSFTGKKRASDKPAVANLEVGQTPASVTFGDAIVVEDDSTKDSTSRTAGGATFIL